MNLHIVILAAGNGTRMYSNLPKVLHPLGGKPLLEHVVLTAQSLKPKKIHVVYGDAGEAIKEYFHQYNTNFPAACRGDKAMGGLPRGEKRSSSPLGKPGVHTPGEVKKLIIHWVKQPKRLGTGHAVMQTFPFIEQASQVLILYGDVPLITTTTIEHLIKSMPENGLSLLSANFSDPTGFGRIVRDSNGAIQAIVEEKDATLLQRQIKEINSGIIVTSSRILRNYLPRLNKRNAQGEYYLTDIIAMLYADCIPINSLQAFDPEEVAGVNDRKQLAKLERKYQKNLANIFMLRGLSLIDPERFDVRGDLTFGSDVKIDVNVVVEGKVHIGDTTTVGPNNFLKNTRIGNNVVIRANCVIEDSIIEDNCIVGPFARIRPHTHLAPGAHVGNFIELKNTTMGKKSKAHHVGYLGDTTIGKNVNIGAGTITCNYDGVTKHKTVVGDGVFVGSLSTLVAPVKLGKNAYIGAGSVITKDAPANKLTLARSRQVTIKHWKRKSKEK